MFNNLTNTAVEDALEEDVLAAMGGEPAKGKEKSTGKQKPDESKAKSGTSTTTKKAVVSVMADKDLDSAFQNDEDEDTDEDEDQDDVEDKKKDKKKGVKKTEDKDEDEDEDEDNQDEDEDNDDENADDDKKDEDEDEDKDDNSPVEVADFLKARVNLLLEKGEWKPFEFDGKKPEDIEWDEDAFEEIELQQRAWQKEALREELLGSFGPYGRDIAEYAANGGNPEELIDIFKEQQAIKAIDISTEEGQKEIVFQYQTQMLKRNPARANKEIERLIADKMLEDDAKEAKETIEGHLKEQAEAMKKDQEEAKQNFEKQTKANQQKFVTDVTDLVNKADDIPADEKRDVIKLLTSFRHELPNGTKVNDFYFKLAEFRKDLRNYVDMVRFVTNKNKFIKSLKNEGKSAEANKAFRLAKGSNANRKLKTSQADSNRSAKKGTGFKLL